MKMYTYEADLLATTNEAEPKASDKCGNVVAQFPLRRHEESVQEGPCPIPDED